MPDDPATLAGLDETVEFLAERGVPLRIDPILEPIGFGFAASLGRYLEVRRRYPDAEMMMGIGNLTELTDADSAPINVLLLGFCQELGIRSVLTTQVINWARTQRARVRPGPAAGVLRRAAPHAAQARRAAAGDAARRRSRALRRAKRSTGWRSEIKDHNYRLFAEDGQLHAVTAGLHAERRRSLRAVRAAAKPPRRGRSTPSHAFYLGYEMAKAVTALTLGKDYRQDEALDWGFLTRAEQHHRLTRIAAGDSPAKADSTADADQSRTPS